MDNSNKQTHGTNGKEAMDKMISSLLEKDYIISVEKPYRVGDPGVDEKQFYFQFLIEFRDNEQWILQHTTSLRDRIKEQQWDSYNIKRLNSYVKKAYVVVPDDLGEKEEKAAQAYDRKIREKEIISALDGIIPFEKAYALIEKKAASIMDAGRARALLGLNFERKVADSLNNRPNLERWKNNSDLEVGYLYSLYKDIMNKLGIRQSEILSLQATTNIPKLQSGGSPKTDVLLEVETLNGNVDFTFSCKRSTADKVSVHEYTADAFANVLNPEDNALRELLLEFQAAGGAIALGAEKSAQLEKHLKPYIDKLSNWVMGGIGGEGDPKTQWASHIITVNENDNTYHVSTIAEYIEQYKTNVVGQFGTPFSWTYPSGGKGKRIQLKGKLL